MNAKISLFGLSQEFRALEELSNELEVNEDTGEIIDNSEQLKTLFDELEGNFIDKLDSCQYIRRELDSNVSLLAAEIKRLQQRKKALENRSERLKTLMCDSMLVSGETKLKGKHSFSLGKRKVLQIDENITPDFFNQDYIRVTKEFDKKKLTQDLKEGTEVEGAKMVEKVNFSIR
jgi:hypothetical protein